jgi:viologen exporter family transport system permease protein
MSGLRLLIRLIAASLRAQAQYPASAIMLAIGQFLGNAIEILAVWALFDRFGSVHGWRFGEVAVFYGFVHMVFAVADVLCRGFDVLGTEFLRTGDFDRVLLRPRAATLQLMAHEFRISRVGRFAQGLIVLLIGAHAIGLEWSAASIAVAFWAGAGGVALFFAIVVLQATMSFWTIEGLEVANVVTYGGVQAAQFPLSLYNGWLRGALTYVVPLACVAYFPVLLILGRADPLGTPAWVGVVSPIAGFLFLGIAFVAWRFGVRHYTSTGS